MSKGFVAVLMGSDPDLPQLQPASDTLAKFEIKTGVKVSAAHHRPVATHLAEQIMATAGPWLAAKVRAKREEFAQAARRSC